MMKNLILVMSLIFVLTSCLKKIDKADNLNTNIFDKEYAGPCWFTIEDTYTYINGNGQTRVRTEAVLYESKMPGLKPSSVKINCQVNDQQSILLNVITNYNGDYPFYYDAIPESSNEYCFEAGIYLEAEDSIINKFTVCTQP